MKNDSLITTNSIIQKEAGLSDVCAFIIKNTQAFRLHLIFMTFSVGIMALEVSLKPYLIKMILDRAEIYSIKGDYSTMLIPIISYFVVTLLTLVCLRVYNYLIEIKMVPRLREHITMKIISNLLLHNLTYFQNQLSGTISNRVNDLAGYIPEFIQLLLDRFLFNFLMLFIASFALGSVSFKYALIMIAWVAFCMLLTLLFLRSFKDQSKNWAEAGAKITGKIVDMLSNFLLIKLFANQDYEKNELHKSIEKATHAEENLHWIFLSMWGFFDSSFCILLGVSLYFLFIDRVAGVITIGDFALILGVNISVANYLRELAKNFSQFSKVLSKIIQALQLIRVPRDLVDKPNAVELVVRNGEICFENVRFNYPGCEPLFEDKSIIIKPGQKVALVGYSGSGKSTFVNLILRLYEISSGNILIDGTSINDVTQNSLRRSIAMIPQDLNLFHRSLFENIRYGKPEASDADVIEAAQKSLVHDFIMTLPEGYNTIVGERGIKLSGGQRQRIAIARAVLKNAPILILDEATNQLDSVTENKIQESLFNLMQGKTTIVIAHRISTLSFMDRILVLHDGKIVEDGKHEELLKKKGYYSQLWLLQVGGFLPDSKFDYFEKH